MKEKITKIIIIIATITILLGFGLIEKVSASENYYAQYSTYTIEATSNITKNNLYTDYAAVFQGGNYNINTISFKFDNKFNLPNSTKLYVYLNIDTDGTNSRINIDFGKTQCIANSMGYECTDNVNNASEIVKPDIEYQAWIYNVNNTNSSTPYEIQYINDNLFLLKFQIPANFGNIDRLDILTNISNRGALNETLNTYYIGINRYTYIVMNDNDSVTQAINNQTQSIIGETHTYNNTPSDTIDRTQMDEYQEAEDNLLNNIDLSGAEDIEVSINANASNFIWGIVNRLRGISGKIVLLFTSILSLGIIKMVMNR